MFEAMKDANKRLWTKAWIVGCMWLLASCSAFDPTPEGPFGINLSGTIVDAATKQPVDTAEVSVWQGFFLLSEELDYTSTTTGRYSLGFVIGEECRMPRVGVHSSGYEYQTAAIACKNGSQRIDFELVRCPASGCE